MPAVLPPNSGAFHALRPLVLASASPRRRELLTGLGLQFDIRAVEGEPVPTLNDDPATYAVRAASAKAEAAARECAVTSPDAVVLGADTIVVLHEESGPVILGKPATPDEALAMLLHLAGRTHAVITACCLVWMEKGLPVHTECFHDTAEVRFYPWPEPTLRAYVATGECTDKAGSYAIQGKGAFLVSGIKGQWTTIVGLPVLDVAQRLLAGGAIA